MISKGMNVMPALSKFLVLLALILLASHANAFTSLSSVAGSLGDTILVKLELWELVIVFNKKIYSATNLCLRYASAKCGR
jgi:hypothetical protein